MSRQCFCSCDASRCCFDSQPTARMSPPFLISCSCSNRTVGPAHQVASSPCLFSAVPELCPNPHAVHAVYAVQVLALSRGEGLAQFANSPPVCVPAVPGHCVPVLMLCMLCMLHRCCPCHGVEVWLSQAWLRPRRGWQQGTGWVALFLKL